MDTKATSKTSISIDLRVICLLLILIIAGMLLAWRPWDQQPTGEKRKITITGEASVKATPDEFTFYPYFERTGTDYGKLKDGLNDYGAKLLGEIKKLGVKEEDVRLDSSAYDRYYYPYDEENNETKTITLNVQITVPHKELAQKVQDYLSKTDAKGQLTSQPSFSEKKAKQLESQARQQAIKDARAKADQTADGLGANIGKVLAVNDQQNKSFVELYATADNALRSDGSADTSLPVTPGKQDISYSVQVVFELN